jgi:DNA phosphorothioation-dependent restriction protein DptH
VPSWVSEATQLPGEEIKKFAAEIVLRGIYSSLLQLGHSMSPRLAIVVDEAHRVANLEAVKKLLKEARAFGAAVFLSSQEARDFDDFVFANAGSLLSLKLSETTDSEIVAKLLGGSREAVVLADRLRNLPQFNVYWKNDQNTPYTRVRVTPFFERLRSQ